MNNAGNDYGLSTLAILNAVIFVGFAYRFFKPANPRDWRGFGAYRAFIAALFKRRHELAKEGPYAYVRHPQYIGLAAIMFGFLLQWPTLLTLAMFPVLVVMYVCLAIAEERDSEQAFGQAWRDYAAKTPRFVPHRSEDGRAEAIGNR